MKILFVSGESTGGAPKSTIELARLLHHRGHQVDVLLGDRPSARSGYQRAVNLWIKTGSVPIWNMFLGGLLRLPGRRIEAEPLEVPAPRLFRARVPENAYRRLHRSTRYDVVVANSLPRRSMTLLCRDLRTWGTPLVVYLRESHSVTHFTMTGLRPEAVVANSRELQRALIREGVACEFIPSAVDLDAAAVESSRESVVLVNPIAANRVDLIPSLAAARPDIPFVLQESWPLASDDLERLREVENSFDNVTVRRRTQKPADVYRDARVVLAPYPTGRPRVVLEAQHNGIPILAVDQPALAELLDHGGIVVASDADAEAWLRELERLWDDHVLYKSLATAGQRWSRRDEVQPHEIATRFERLLESVTTQQPQTGAE